MAFQYTFRADDISTWDVDTRDLVENRDRELELYASTIDNSLLNLNADNLGSGTVPSSRVTGSYTGITQVGTLSAGVASYSIGDTGPAGGKVFITPSTIGNTTGLYFEIAPVSAQVQRTWAQFAPTNYTSTSVPLAQFNNIGTGKSNTVAIVNQGNSNPDTCAAKYCDDYTYGGFSDWFLPSRFEVSLIYTNRVALGNDFGLGYFWTSSQISAGGAYCRYFTTGADDNLAKGNNFYVRPVRSFSTIGLNVVGTAVVRTAATQDGVILAGRAGGTSDYAVNIVPTTLTASQTVTLPNVSGTAITTGNLSSITSVGFLDSLNVGNLNISGAGANRWLTINAPTGYYAIQYFQINGVFKWHYEVNPAGDRWSLVQTGVAERIGVTSAGATFSGNVTAATFVTNNASPSLELGAWSASSTWSAVQGYNGYLLMGNTSDRAVYLRSNTTAPVRLGANQSNALIVNTNSSYTSVECDGGYKTSGTFGGYQFASRNTGDIYTWYSNNGDAFLYSSYFGDNVIGVARTTGITYLYRGVTGNVQNGSYGSMSMYGENGGYVGINFPGQATTWMSATNGQIFGIYRNNTTWNFYVSNGTFVPSDARYKRDIQPLEQGMNLIRHITPVSYDPLTENLEDDPETTVGRTHYGFTTQNVLEALELSGETRDVAVVDVGGPDSSMGGDRQYLNHSALIAPMIKAIQELDTRLQQLETV